MKLIKTIILFLVLLTGNTIANEINGEFNYKKAVRIAEEAIKIAQKRGYNVSATVIDTNGVIMATVKAEQAWGHTPRVSFKKAFTALKSQTNSSILIEKLIAGGYPEMQKFIVANMPDQDNLIFLKGGIIITKNSKIVGAIGVGGAPDGQFDEEIAIEAIKSVK